MDGWDVAILMVTGYIAVTALVRLMIARRDRLLQDLRAQIELAKRQRKKQQHQETSARSRRDKAA